MRRKLIFLAHLGLTALTVLGLLVMQTEIALADTASDDGAVQTATPIKHLVVIFDENISFDHYFATYPHAANPAGEPRFTPLPNTPNVNGLNGALLSRNP